MARYFLTKKLNQNFEQVIHKDTRLYKPKLSETIYLGEFKEEHLALKESQQSGNNKNGCFWCFREIHLITNLKIF